MLRYIDSHVHFQDFIDISIEDVVNNAKEVGVEKLLNVSSSVLDWDAIETILEEYEDIIIPAFGIHPWNVLYVDDSLEKLQQLLIKYPNALIGEIGLDGNREEFSLQIELFEKQIALAKQYKRPIIVHGLKSQSYFEKNWDIMPEKFVFHSYNGKTEFLKQIVAKDGYVSLSLSILNNSKKEEIVSLIPLDRMLLETDSPHQGLDRDIENEPKNMPILAFEIAKILNMDIFEFTNLIYQNSLEFMKVER